MTRQAENILETLFTLAHEPTCRPIFFCGAPGTGKTALCDALADVPQFGITHIPLRLWHLMSSHERMAAWSFSKMAGDMDKAAFWAGYQNIVDWPKFNRDIQILSKTGEVEVTDIYDDVTQARTGSLYITIPKDPPHLLLVSGSCLMHRPVIDSARAVFFLEVSHSLLSASDAFNDGPACSLSPQHRLERWAGAYCLRFQRQAIVVGQAAQGAMHGHAIRLKEQALIPT